VPCQKKNKGPSWLAGRAVRPKRQGQVKTGLVQNGKRGYLSQEAGGGLDERAGCAHPSTETLRRQKQFHEEAELAGRQGGEKRRFRSELEEGDIGTAAII